MIKTGGIAYNNEEEGDVTLGASGHWLGTRIRAGGTAMQP